MPPMPAMASTHLMNTGPKLCAPAQTGYQSGIGKVLYLVKWLQWKLQTAFENSLVS